MDGNPYQPPEQKSKPPRLRWRFKPLRISNPVTIIIWFLIGTVSLVAIAVLLLG